MGVDKGGQKIARHLHHAMQPLPGEPPSRRQLVMLVVVAIFLVGMGVVVGVWIAPDTPMKTRQRLVQLESDLKKSQLKVGELERTLMFKEVDAPLISGRLKAADSSRHLRRGREYARALKRVKAQSAAELLEWFVVRWNKLLDEPQPDDRVARRAATLSLLVGGMAENLNPEDYVPWQAEFFAGDWLGELHFDLDSDGFPGKRSRPNTRDGFADVSLCQIAMALNQAVTDARVLVMPNMRCDRPWARMSVFLQGSTFDDALHEFVRAVRQQGFLVVERMEKGSRLILIGAGSRGPSEAAAP